MSKPNQASAKRVDAIVVLGGGINQDGTLTETSIRRVRFAIERWKELGGDFAFIVSGAYGAAKPKPPEGITEARLMSKIATANGVPNGLIMLEETSVDTMGNLYFSATELLLPLGLMNVLIVSSKYHIPRVEKTAKLLLEPFGIQFRCEGEPDASASVSTLIHEAIYSTVIVALSKLVNTQDDVHKLMQTIHPAYKQA